MGFRKKKSLIDQAGDYVEQVKPHAEAAIVSAYDFVQETVVPALADAREKAGPVIADARDKAVPVIADARAKAAPVIAAGAAKAAGRAAAARDLADAKVAELKGEKPKKKGRLKKLVLFAGVAGGVAFVAKKLQGGGQSDNWQSSYNPSPAPTPPSTPPTPSAPQAGVDDTGGASPDEALSDAVEAPHPTTTPDQPAEVVDLEEGKDT
jgi:hypothetical protein